MSETLTTVEVRFTGMLARALDFGVKDTVTYHLPDPATYGDLLTRVGEQFGERFPDNMWDRQAGDFHDHISALYEGVRLEGPDAPIGDGAEIIFIIGIAGGADLPPA